MGSSNLRASGSITGRAAPGAWSNASNGKLHSKTRQLARSGRVRTRRLNETCQPPYFFQRLLATASAKLRAVGSVASLVRSVTRIFKNLWAAPVT